MSCQLFPNVYPVIPQGVSRDLRQLNDIRLRQGFSAFPGRSAEEEALIANCAPARQADAPTAVALALCGDSAQTARTLKRATEESAKQPDNTNLKAIDLPSLRAAMALKLDRPAEAIELLQPAMHYERRYPEVVYLRGLSYLRARKGMEAAAEFQKIIDHRGAYWGPFYPVSYVALGRAAAMAGDTARARKAYQDFLALWKDADPGTPILVDARKEYAALR
jgi:eukaryotic-like serine/threonine-protein kinase